MKAADSAGIHNARSAQALRDGGYGFALRYHYNSSVAEIETLHAAGVGFALIAEFDTATWHPPLHNPETGTAHGTTAVAVARRLGLPPGAVIWFTADTGISAGQYARPRLYWAGAAAVVRAAGYLCGAYGGSKLIDWLHVEGVADRTWQCGAAAWNEWSRSTTACLEQLAGSPTIGGVQVDVNDVRDLAACGVWMPDGVTTSGPPPPIAPIPDTFATVPFSPTPTPEDDHMPAPRFQTPTGDHFAVLADGRLHHVPNAETLAVLTAGPHPAVAVDPVICDDAQWAGLLEFYGPTA